MGYVAKVARILPMELIMKMALNDILRSLPNLLIANFLSLSYTTKFIIGFMTKIKLGTTPLKNADTPSFFIIDLIKDVRL